MQETDDFISNYILCNFKYICEKRYLRQNYKKSVCK